MFFAVLSAGGLGAGLLGLAPILKLILGEKGESLAQLARDFNAEGRLIEVPQWVVERLPEGKFEGVLLVLGVLAVVTVLGATANFMHQYISLSLCTKLVGRIRLDAFRHAIRMPLSEVVRRGPAEFTSRIIRDSAELHGGLVTLTSKTTAQLTKGVAAFIAAIIFDWRIVLIAAVVGPILAVILRKCGKRIRRGARGALRQQEVLLRVAGESLQGLRAIKTSTAEASMLGRFNHANRLVMREEFRARTASSLASPLVEVIAILVVIGLAGIAVREIVRGSMSFEDFVLSLGALAVAGGAVRPIAGFIGVIQAASAPAERLQEILAIPAEPKATRESVILPRHVRDITIERVSFRYPGAQQLALDCVSLVVRHGEHVAIVGPNGCGKTTLLAMLPRLLTPDSGRIAIDSVDIQSVSLKSLRRQIGVVTQESVLIQASIAANISLGMPAATRSQIESAAARAHADSFIREIPGGLDAEISEHGASLSGGQRQRLVIARAILRDPAILILDEATSQIDATSEAQIGQAIAEFGRERTVLVVAHRLSTMLAADRIVVMDRGRVIDSGTHAELIQRCTVYERLARAQMQSAEGVPAGVGTQS